MAINTNCLLSTVKNTSGGTMIFGFLPPHGKTLTSGQEYTVDGNIVEAVIRGERVTSKRHLDALKAALAAGYIDIISTPSPVLYDEANDSSHVLDIQGGALFAVDGCWIAPANTSSIAL